MVYHRSQIYTHSWNKIEQYLEGNKKYFARRYVDVIKWGSCECPISSIFFHSFFMAEKLRGLFIGEGLKIRDQTSLRWWKIKNVLNFKSGQRNLKSEHWEASVVKGNKIVNCCRDCIKDESRKKMREGEHWMREKRENAKNGKKIIFVANDMGWFTP